MGHTSIPTGWNTTAHAKWLANSRTEAIRMVLDELNASTDKPLPRVLQLAYYFFLANDFRSALTILEHNRERYPTDRELLSNQAVCLERLRQYGRAVQVAEEVIRLYPDHYPAFDVLAKSFSRLALFDKATVAGRMALAIKDRQADFPAAAWSLPTESPAEYAQSKKNVVAFSLWGSKPAYLRGALRNMLLLPDLLPGWTGRFYVDETVPADCLKALRGLGAEIVIRSDTDSLRERLCWRFLIADDATVGRFLVRDTDAVLGLREAVAIHQWTASSAWFHVIRDWWTHTDPMLAGMWGGIAGVLPKLGLMLRSYSPGLAETPNIDQWFLRDRVWGYVRTSCLIHDRFFGESPSTLPDIFTSPSQHIGQNEFAAFRDKQEMLLRPWLSACPSLRISSRITVRPAAGRALRNMVNVPDTFKQ